MKIKYKVCEAEIVDGKVDYIEYEKEEEFLGTEGRHKNICIMCGFPDYPNCIENCRNEKTNS